MIDKTQQLLNQVSQIIKCHKEHANKQGENFNIFSILRMERREVKTHSNFIYELLNPKGSHGQDKMFLESFAKIVLNSEAPDTAERPNQEDLTAENRRIDFTLETDKNVIGIEMKIDAGDQSHQLWDYQQEIKSRAELVKSKDGKNKGTRLFYLTLDSKEAWEGSRQSRDKPYIFLEVKENEQAEDKEYEYRCISFEKHILNWIDDCIKQSAEKSVLREALIQYKILIEKITGQNTDMNTEIAEILKDSDNLKTAIALEKVAVKSKIQFKIDFWSDLLQELGKDNNSHGFSFSNKYNSLEGKHKDIKTSCRIYYTESRNNTEQGIIFKLKDIKVSLVAYHNLCFNIDSLDSQKWYKNCSNKEDVVVNKKGKFFPKSINNHLNFKALDSDSIEMLIGKTREETIKSLAGEFKDLVEELENNQ